jgi:hypothetical protein
VKPFPLYPGLHAHVKLPRVLVQLADELQPLLLVEHSLISGTSTHIHDVMESYWCKTPFKSANQSRANSEIWHSHLMFRAAHITSSLQGHFTIVTNYTNFWASTFFEILLNLKRLSAVLIRTRKFVHVRGPATQKARSSQRQQESGMRTLKVFEDRCLDQDELDGNRLMWSCK